MRRALVLIVTIIVLAAVFTTGCSTTPKTNQSRNDEQAPDRAAEQSESGANVGEMSAQFAWADGPLSDGFRREPELQNVHKDLVRLEQLLMNFDYYGQFVNGGHTFEDFLTTFYGLETGPYYPGKGVERSFFDQNGEQWVRYSRVLLENQVTGQWWQIVHEQKGAEIVHETLVGPYGVPRKVRFFDPATGIVAARATMFGEQVAEAEQHMDPDDIAARLNEERAEEVRSSLSPLYAHLQETGRAPIVLADRTVYAAHYTSDTAEGSVIVYYSPDIPGGILRLDYNGSTFMEITGWIEAGERRITEADLAAASAGGADRDGFQSNGSAREPVSLSIDDYHTGAVGPGGTSFYTFEAPYRGDLTIQATAPEGYVSLYYYEYDNTFREWVSGTEGYDIEHTVYYLNQGDRVYLTIETNPDYAPNGCEYTIGLQLDPMLDSLGVRMYEDYSRTTSTLKTGKNHRLSAAPGVLEFYRVELPGSGVRMTIDNLDMDTVDFKFLDVTDGSYASMGGMWNSPEQKIIGLEGTAPGSSAFFYLVTSPFAKPREIQVNIVPLGE